MLIYGIAGDVSFEEGHDVIVLVSCKPWSL